MPDSTAWRRVLVMWVVVLGGVYLLGMVGAALVHYAGGVAPAPLLMITVAQVLLLRRRAAVSVGWWLLASLGPLVAVSVTRDSIVLEAAPAVGSVLYDTLWTLYVPASLAMGIGQTILLRRTFRNAGAWLAASTLAGLLMVLVSGLWPAFAKLAPTQLVVAGPFVLQAAIGCISGLAFGTACSLMYLPGEPGVPRSDVVRRVVPLAVCLIILGAAWLALVRPSSPTRPPSTGGPLDIYRATSGTPTP